MELKNMNNTLERPAWFSKLVRKKDTVSFVSDLADGEKIFTVCDSAKCPNRGECFANKTLTFMILGGICTRGCRFCAVETGKPQPVNKNEIPTILNIIRKLQLKYIVITSVTRDDLIDGGAKHFADVTNAIHSEFPNSKVEVLTPDFRGNIGNLKIVLDAKPYVFNHNIEMVPRLYPDIRPNASYEISLNLLREAKKIDANLKVKSGIMIGLGETWDEIIDTFKDIYETGCDFLTVGHYIQPSKRNYPIQKYYEEEDFKKLKEIALGIGFKYVMSSPLVRSSYLAHQYTD